MSRLRGSRLWRRLRNLYFRPVRPVNTCGFFVLGMHRSGTSCLTGLLETSGLWLGEVPRQNEHNAKGTLEDRWIQRVNSEILRQFGGDWDRPPQRVDWRQVDPLALCIALEPYRKHERWALKDPRLVLTFEAWVRLVPHHTLIGTYRHPIAVARSLEARNGMPLAQGLTLWTHYNERLVLLHNRSSFPLVSFDREGAEYIEQFRLLCETVRLRFDPQAANDFYDARLSSQRGDGAGALTPRTAYIYDYLQRHQLRADKLRRSSLAA